MDTMAHTSNPGTGKAEAGGLLCVWDENMKPCFKNNKGIKRKEEVGTFLSSAFFIPDVVLPFLFIFKVATLCFWSFHS